MQKSSPSTAQVFSGQVSRAFATNSLSFLLVMLNQVWWHKQWPLWPQALILIGNLAVLLLRLRKYPSRDRPYYFGLFNLIYGFLILLLAIYSGWPWL